MMYRQVIVSVLCIVFLNGCFYESSLPFSQSRKDCIKPLEMFNSFGSLLNQEESVVFSNDSENIQLKFYSHNKNGMIFFHYYFWDTYSPRGDNNFFNYGEYRYIRSILLALSSDTKKEKYDIIAYKQAFRKRYSHVLAIKRSHLFSLLHSRNPFIEKKPVNEIYVLYINPMLTNDDTNPIDLTNLQDITSKHKDSPVDIKNFIREVRTLITEQIESNPDQTVHKFIALNKSWKFDEQMYTELALSSDELNTPMSQISDNLLEKIINIHRYMLTKKELDEQIKINDNYIMLKRKQPSL